MSRLKKKYPCGQSRAPKGAANPRSSNIKSYQRDTDVLARSKLPHWEK